MLDFDLAELGVLAVVVFLSGALLGGAFLDWERGLFAAAGGAVLLLGMYRVVESSNIRREQREQRARERRERGE